MNMSKGLVLLAGTVFGFSGAVQAQQATGTNRDEIRAIVAETLADAETRSSLLQGGAAAGHDGRPGGRFFVASPDGNFRLNVGGQIQFRYIANFRDNSNTFGAVAGDEYVGGFQMRRTKIDFTGHIVNPDWTYQVTGAFNRGNGNFELEDSWIGYNFGNGFKMRLGQFKAPFLREELVSSRRQLAVERSITNEVFNQDFSQGIELAYETQDWRVTGMFNDGFGSRNTEFTSPIEAEWGATGRFEYKFAGSWRQFADFTAEQGGDFGALLGLAAHYQESANQPGTTFDTDTLFYTADLSLEGDSWNLFGAFVGRYTEVTGTGGADTTFNDWGAVVQGGYRFLRDTEIFARWDAIFVDNDRNLNRDNFHFLTVGFNQYYAGHAAKATVDFVVAFDETADLAGFGATPGQGFPTTGAGVIGTNQDQEWVLRLQFQLLF